MNAHIPRCQYIRTDGRRCGSPALKTKRWCYFHYEVNRKTVTLDVPPLEDGNAVQLALTDLARAVADDRIPLKNAALLAYILQTASANLKKVQLGVFNDSMVRDLPDLDPYSRGPAREDASPVEGQGFSPAKKNGAPAPSSLPEAGAQPAGAAPARSSSAPSAQVSSAPSAVKGPDPRPSASIRGKDSSAPSAMPASAPSAVKGSASLPQKVEAAKSGSLNDAKELLDLLNAVS